MNIPDDVANFVSAARKLGWVPQESNKTARTRFFFDHPNDVFVAVYIHRRAGIHLYTVGHDTTSWLPRAIQLLESAATKRIEDKQ